MKNKPIVAQLPDPPLLSQDCPTDPLVVILQAEIVAMTSACHVFQVARADYEMKRAALTLKMLLSAIPEEGLFELELNQKGGLIVTETTGTPATKTVYGEGDSRTEFLTY